MIPAQDTDKSFLHYLETLNIVHLERKHFLTNSWLSVEMPTHNSVDNFDEFCDTAVH